MFKAVLHREAMRSPKSKSNPNSAPSKWQRVRSTKVLRGGDFESLSYCIQYLW